NGRPIFRGSHKGHRALWPELDGKRTRTPKHSARMVTTIRLRLVANLANASSLMSEARPFVMNVKPQGMRQRCGGDLVTALVNEQRVTFLQWFADIALVRTKVHRWP